MPVVQQEVLNVDNYKLTHRHSEC